MAIRAPEKIEAAIYSDRSLFYHDREMMKQAYLIMKTFAAPSAFYPSKRHRGGLYQSLNIIPPSPVCERASKEVFVARGKNYGFPLIICLTHCCNPYYQLC
jgi:hypothetical protein